MSTHTYTLADVKKFTSLLEEAKELASAYEALVVQHNAQKSYIEILEKERNRSPPPLVPWYQEAMEEIKTSNNATATFYSALYNEACKTRDENSAVVHIFRAASNALNEDITPDPNFENANYWNKLKGLWDYVKRNDKTNQWARCERVMKAI